MNDPELALVEDDLDKFLDFELAVCRECPVCAGCAGACAEGLWDQHTPCACGIDFYTSE